MENKANFKFAPPGHNKRFHMNGHRKTLIRTGCLLTACAFVLYGLSRGEAAIVLNKAVNICLECIGLG